MNQKEKYNLALQASIEAGKAILEVYKKDFDIEYKTDNSPLTEADKKAHDIIVDYLKKTDIPVLSEEGKNIPYEERKSWSKLWIVDPLDGTKEFIKRNGEFTVNIALIENDSPVFGAVYAPVLDEFYIGLVGKGAWKVNAACEKGIFHWDDIREPNAVSLPSENNKDYYGIVASRSHLNQETTDFINEIRKQQNEVRIVSKGSSLKLCMVAEGVADVYPRFAPTSEWDTAAGHAVAVASGAKVVQALDEEKELVYNKADILNPWFMVKR